MKKIVLLPMILFLMFSLVGCKELGDSKVDCEVIVTEVNWNDQGSSEEKNTFDSVGKRDVLSDSSFGTLAVKKIKEDYIVISVTEGFVENKGEGINMNADDLTKIKLKKGESITISSKTYDAGITITIQYN